MMKRRNVETSKYQHLFWRLRRQFHFGVSTFRRFGVVVLVAAVMWPGSLVSAQQDKPRPGDQAPPPPAPLQPPSLPAGAEDQPAVDPGDRSEKGAENNPLANELTEAVHQAVTKGFDYLRSQQNSDGSYGRGRYGRHVAITALCALAYMADGNLPNRGPYGEDVSKALDFILDHSTETGLLASEASHGPMYGHGFATLFLGEVYGMNPEDTRVREALVKAVDLIVGTQNEEGGWRYNPVPYDADVSVTICQVMALRSARNAGIKVPKQTIDRAVEYVRKCQNTDGGFKYMLQAGGSAWPRTAAGVATLYYAGIYEDDSIDRGLDYLMRNAFPGAGMAGQAHYYYGHYYAVQAMYLAGGERWQKWWPASRDEILSRQSPSGGWLDQSTGGADATAMSLIVLQMPKRYLPIFQR
jgi:hypothetical protein